MAEFEWEWKSAVWQQFRRVASWDREGGATGFIGALAVRMCLIGAAVIILIVVAAAAVQHMNERELKLALVSRDVAQIERVLPKLRNLTSAQRAEIFLDNSARTGFIAYFEKRLNAVAAEGHGFANYRRAEKILAELQSFLPDSQVVQGLTDEMRARRNVASGLDESIATPLVGGVHGLLAAGSIRRDAVAPEANIDSVEPRASTSRRAERPRISRATLIRSPAAPLPRNAGAQADFQGTRVLTRSDALSGPAVPVTQGAQTISVLASRLQDQDPVARVEALKRQLLAQAQANEVDAALETLRDLRTRLPAKDTFVAKTAPRAIGEAYLRLASTAAKDGRLKEALMLAERGSEIAPSQREASIARKRYQRYVDIDDQLTEQDRLSVHHIRWKISRVAKQSPDEIPGVTQRWVRDLAERIGSTPDPKLASRLLQDAQAIFPEATQFQVQKSAVNGSATARVAP